MIENKKIILDVLSSYTEPLHSFYAEQGLPKYSKETKKKVKEFQDEVAEDFLNETRNKTIAEQIMNQELVPLHEQLRLVRVYKKIKQEDLAKDLGISTMGLSYLERGKRKLDTNFLIKWSGRLGLRLDTTFYDIV